MNIFKTSEAKKLFLISTKDGKFPVIKALILAKVTVGGSLYDLNNNVLFLSFVNFSFIIGNLF